MRQQIEKYSINNETVVARLLPWFMRGKRLYVFLLGISQPIVSVYLAWKEWVYRMILDAVLTTQPIVLNWYLNEKYGKHILEQGKRFYIGPCLNEYCTIYNFDEDNPEDFDDFFYNIDENNDSVFISDHGSIDILNTDYTFYIYYPTLRLDNDGRDRLFREITKKIDSYKTRRIKYKFIKQY